jgi:transcriptional regulator with XRE-family HTH domain
MSCLGVRLLRRWFLEAEAPISRIRGRHPDIRVDGPQMSFFRKSLPQKEMSALVPGNSWKTAQCRRSAEESGPGPNSSIRGSRLAQCWTRIPALPFCRTSLETQWKKSDYPSEIKHLGDHIRRRRIDLNLCKKEVAAQIGVDAETIKNWELGRCSPYFRSLPAIMNFLGWDPRPACRTVGEALKRYRTGRGISQKELAGLLKVDPSTVAKWERGVRVPVGAYLIRVVGVLGQSVELSNAADGARVP